MSGQFGQRFSVDVLVGHIDVDAFDRHGQQFPIVDFLGARTEKTDQHFAAAGHGHDVPGVDHGVCRGIQDLPVLPNTLDEHTLVRNQRLGFLCRLADNRSTFLDAKCAKFELVPGRAGTAGFLLAAVLLLIPFARGLEIDAEERRAKQRQNDGGSDRSENIRDGVGHRHRIQCFLGFLGRQAKAVDGIGRQAHRRGDRLRSGIEPRGRADAITRELGADIGRSQTEKADHDGKQRLRNAVLRDAAHELRSDAVADGEQEHQEKHRLERTADRDPELSDDDRRNQRRGHRPETKSLVGERAEVIPEGQRQEDGDLRIAAKRLHEPVNHDVIPFVDGAVIPRRL